MRQAERHEQQAGLVNVLVVLVDDSDRRLACELAPQPVRGEGSTGSAAEDHDSLRHDSSVRCRAVPGHGQRSRCTQANGMFRQEGNGRRAPGRGTPYSCSASLRPPLADTTAIVDRQLPPPALGLAPWPLPASPPIRVQGWFAGESSQSCLVTRKLSGRATTWKPCAPEQWITRLEARPVGRQRLGALVTKAAAFTGCWLTEPNHSRSPGPIASGSTFSPWRCCRFHSGLGSPRAAHPVDVRRSADYDEVRVGEHRRPACDTGTTLTSMADPRRSSPQADKDAAPS